MPRCASNGALDDETGFTFPDFPLSINFKYYTEPTLLMGAQEDWNDETGFTPLDFTLSAHF
jgi:hypothetical protein